MSSINFDNLVKTGMIKPEKVNEFEIAGLIKSGHRRFQDAGREELSEESRFDLAYNAAHSFALAALRLKGYRSNNRYIVFQVLPFTLDVGPEVWKVLSKAHQKRNLAEYEGFWELDSLLFKDLMTATDVVQKRLNLNSPRLAAVR